MLKFYLWVTCLLLVFGLTACNFPGAFYAVRSPTLQAARSTAVVSATPAPETNTPEIATKNTPGLLQTASFTPSLAASQALTATIKTSPTPTAICDRAAPGVPLDITIPDDTRVLPGQSFTKTWRLVNEGSCAWTLSYAVVYFSGSQMSAVPRNDLPDVVASGEEVDVSVDMIAPANPGLYQGNWKLSNSEGRLFGIGPDGDSPFWVRIVVIEEDTPTLTLTPVPTLTPTPVVYVTGQNALKPGDGLDLDTNTTANPAVSASDFVYTLGDNHAHRLEPTNGVTFGAPGSTPQPGYQDCIAAPLQAGPLVLDGLPINSTFCYRTNLGLPGWARLVSLDPKTDLLTLEILTWAIP